MISTVNDDILTHLSLKNNAPPPVDICSFAVETDNFYFAWGDVYNMTHLQPLLFIVPQTCSFFFEV
jgi:uncharacterized ParB-like nuclease family protein